MHRKLLILTAALLITTGLISATHAFAGHKKAEDKPAAEEGFTALSDGSSTKHLRVL